LVEAKANIEEVAKMPTGAEGNSRDMIDAALNQVKAEMGIDSTHDWIGSYYQYANRLSALHFLNQAGQPARLLFLYFCGDSSGPGRECPANEEGWAAKLAEVDDCLGLPGRGELADRVGRLFLDVDQRRWPGS
jgi:hypothetical protein